jgi:two-component system nitrate/nitrite response regulator NarL
VTVFVGTGALLREGLGCILSAADFSIGATGADVDEVLPGLLVDERPILFILDVGNDQDTVLRQVRSFRERHPAARIALLADRHQLSDTNIVAAFRAGANAYFLRPNCESFIKSLELVMLGETILPPAALSFILEHIGKAAAEVEKLPVVQRTPPPYGVASSSYSPKLTAREQRILCCLVEGDSNRTIARKNDIAEATVKVHVKAILRKIRVNNRTQAAVWAMSHDSLIGWTAPSPAASLSMEDEPA